MTKLKDLKPGEKPEFGVYAQQTELPMLERSLPHMKTALRDLKNLGAPATLESLYQTLRMSTAMAIFHQKATMTDAIYAWAYFSAREAWAYFSAREKSGTHLDSSYVLYRAMIIEIQQGIEEFEDLIASAKMHEENGVLVKESHQDMGPSDTQHSLNCPSDEGEPESVTPRHK